MYEAGWSCKESSSGIQLLGILPATQGVCIKHIERLHELLKEHVRFTVNKNFWNEKTVYCDSFIEQ